MMGHRARGGGVPARRAVVRWARRMFRREWRQQILAVGVLSLAVAVAVGGASAAYNMAPSRDAEFGRADHRLNFEVSTVRDPAALREYLADVERRLGPIDVIGERRVEAPGSIETFDLRAQDPEGALGAPMLRLLSGRYPLRSGEVALTDDIAHSLGVRLGDSLELGGTGTTVVGLVENPGDLDDDFALTAPWSGERLDMLTVLVRGTEDEVRSIPAELDPGPGFMETRGDTEKSAAALGAVAASSALLLLVGLIAAAGFVVIAQRRLRQLGMLAATGASQRHLRLVVMANGALVGVVAAAVGSVVGILGWAVSAPRMETVAGHRIDGLGLPIGQIAVALLLAVVAATAAAWWPARTMAHVPITRALSGRPPKPRRVRRSLLLAVMLVGAGAGCLMAGVDATNDTGNGALMTAGVLLIPLGIAFAAPVAVRALGPVATRLPIAARLALRDLSRYQGRAGAALAAISLGLGIAVAIVLVAAAATYRSDEGNLSNRQLLFRIEEPNEVGNMMTIPDLTSEEVAERERAVERVAQTLGDARVLGLDVVFDPGLREAGAPDQKALVSMTMPVDANTSRDTGALYVATPEVFDYVGLDPASLDSSTEIVTAQTEPVLLLHDQVDDVEVVELSEYSHAPRSLILPEAAHSRSWEIKRAAWFVESSEPLTDEQIRAAREAASAAGINVEIRRDQEELAQLRSGATLVGVLLALGILSMTVGLVRGEAAADLRTLTAIGASGRLRRRITGVTAGTLALLGALLGTIGAYVGLAAGYQNDLGTLSQVPIVHLLLVVVGLPVLAAMAGWLLSGREPPVLARGAME
jgi:putative ABC transport system permease protein